MVYFRVSSYDIALPGYITAMTFNSYSIVVTNYAMDALCCVYDMVILVRSSMTWFMLGLQHSYDMLQVIC